MPARQSGSYSRGPSGWKLRWYEDGRRRFRSGFDSKSAAREYFATVVKPRLDGLTPTIAPEALTFREFAERYLERYAVVRAPATVQTMRWRLVRPLREFGDMQLAEIRTGGVAVWESGLPPRFRHDVMRAVRQLGRAAVEWEYVAHNPFVTGANPAAPVLEIAVLTPAEVELLADAARPKPDRLRKDPRYDVAVLVGCWCYLRPSELLELERRDLDLDNGLLHVRGTKTARSRRSVPVPLRAHQALSEIPPRIDTRLLFPAPQGGPYALDNFRVRKFARAVEAAGLPKATTPYVLRHSGMSWALAAGVPVTDVARYGGTSVAMLERTYAHQLVTSADSARARMDHFLVAAEEAASEAARS